MNRIDASFKNGKVFAAYLTAGDGELEQQMSYIRALLKAGVNLLEIGIPFSDPIADGPIIQDAMQRALDRGTTLQQVLDLISTIRNESAVAIVVFTYYNPILSMSRSSDPLRAFKKAGADGILIIDLPFEEAAAHLQACHAMDLLPIPVIAPSTRPERIAMLANLGGGFLYYACQKGTTGARKSLPDDLPEKITAIKCLSDLPIMIGFGIADQSSAQVASHIAEGFVVGSYFIQSIQSGASPEQLTLLAKALNIR